jgi:hypothetical protein
MICCLAQVWWLLRMGLRKTNSLCVRVWIDVSLSPSPSHRSMWIDVPRVPGNQHMAMENPAVDDFTIEVTHPKWISCWVAAATTASKAQQVPSNTLRAESPSRMYRNPPYWAESTRSAAGLWWVTIVPYHLAQNAFQLPMVASDLFLAEINSWHYRQNGQVKWGSNLAYKLTFS